MFIIINGSTSNSHYSSAEYFSGVTPSIFIAPTNDKNEFENSPISYNQLIK